MWLLPELVHLYPGVKAYPFLLATSAESTEAETTTEAVTVAEDLAALTRLLRHCVFPQGLGSALFPFSLCKGDSSGTGVHSQCFSKTLYESNETNRFLL